jgi:hypothetical protein
MRRVKPKSEERTIHLTGLSNRALDAAELPAELKILNAGANPSDYGDVLVDEVSLAALERQIQKKSFARILIDFEHASEPDTPKYQPPPRKHAGYGTLALSADGVYLKDIRWTPAGREYAPEYQDLSPTVKLTPGRQVVFVKSLALCPNGAIHDLTFFESEPQTQETDMDTLQESLNGVQAALAALAERVAKLETPPTDQPLDAKVTELEQKLTTLSADLAADAARRDKAAILDGAARDGKVVQLAADAVAALTVEQLKDHVAKLQATVPLSARTPRHVREEWSGAPSIIEQYNAIPDPAQRAAFYAANREKMFGKN